MNLLDQVAEFLRRHGLAARRGVIAVSGGPDSVALARACVMLLEPRSVVLAHLNHQLRGADSAADEAFVVSLPAAWTLPTLEVYCHRIDVARLAAEAGANVEDTARQARYGWLTDCARQAGAAWVATGHTADDQAETVLHHFLRGSGLQGLSGMPERRDLAPGVDLVRPLLPLRRADVIAYILQERLTHCHDGSNDDRSFTRNRLRHELLPLLERAFNPRVVEALARTARQCAEVQQEMSRLACTLLSEVELPRAGTMVVLRRPALAAATSAVVRELLRQLWQRESWPLGAMGFAEWERAAARARGVAGGNDFPGGVRVRLAGQVVQIDRPTL